ncbi:MAG TPA: hypothetical protein VD768_08690 [Sphingomicrobium sp.]|nr:hypothetical protein [Sphingomicrobium sp.]
MNAAFNDFPADDFDADKVPLFPVEPPDGRRDWSEADRQATLRRLMTQACFQGVHWPIPNAGKRNPAKARQEGIRAGVFDTEWQWNYGQAWVELKGYDARGRAGKLRPEQICWGNSMHRMGKRVACFFDPYAAFTWLVDTCGAPCLAREGVR